ncbi:MAG TPA: DbpA RNA binding domain-containing protein [Gemmatimonadales bacterium]|nr:DbpA RNA binding domain-containing protein [Gemmatimonadales bacterium]
MTVAEAKIALERGRPVVLVRPPAVEQAGDVWELIAGAGPGSAAAGPLTVILSADADAAAEWAAAAPAGLEIHAVTGLARTTRLLQARVIPVLAGAALDVAALAQRAACKLEQVVNVVVAWPEALLDGAGLAALDTVLAEARAARRLVLTWNPRAVSDFLERHARRALVVGTPPVDDTGTPLPPVCRVRYCLVPTIRRASAVRDVLDAVAATQPFIWAGGPIIPPAPAAAPPGSGPDAVLCTQLPTRDELAALARWGMPVVFVTAHQLPYLRSIAVGTPLPLPSVADRARDRGEALRERVTALLAARDVDAELALLDPLFQRFDAAEVAAALLAVLGPGEHAQEPPSAAAPLPPARVKLFVNVGKKDRVAAKDLVGALIREVGLAKGDLGRIELRDTFSLIEVSARVAEQAMRGLTGVTLRGRRVVARFDREI